MVSCGTCRSRKVSITQVAGPTPLWYSKAYFSSMGTRSEIGKVLSERCNRVPKLRTFSATAS